VSLSPTFLRGAKTRLTRHDLGRFSGESLHDRLGGAVCEAGCLSRKEFFESWELARRARRLFRGGRVVDLAGGHGLLAHVMLLLDDSSPSALVVDTALPSSTHTLHEALVKAWPRLDGRVVFSDEPIESVVLCEQDVVVSSHACGALTDVVLDRAAAARARVAVLPCCHAIATCDTGPLSGWLDQSLAIDAMRAVRLQARGYRVWTQTIPGSITPKNRLLLGQPT
jgi:hypothetical protein